MRVIILTFGTRGDIQPYVAMSLGLLAAGHTCDICTHATYRKFIESFGVGFVDYPGANPQEMFDYCVLHGIFSLKFMREIPALGWNFMSGWESVLTSCRGKYDLVVSTFTSCNMGITLAEASGVPVVIAHYLPFGETQYFWSPLSSTALHSSTSRPSWVNRLSHELVEYLYGQLSRFPTNQIRGRLGLPSINGFHRGSNWAAKHSAPVVYGFSPSFLPKPPDWPERARVVGYWWLKEPPYTPFPELQAFLASGAPPVYIGFGSVTVPGNADLLPKLLKAVALAKCRALVLAPTDPGPEFHSPDVFISSASVPHSWLFPRMALIIHHGGAGTVAYALKSGVPSIVMPFFGDHHLWASRMVDTGVGPQPVLPAKVNVESLAKMIVEVIADTKMKEALAKMKALIESEDAVGKTVRLLEHAQAHGCFPPESPIAPTPFCPFPEPVTLATATRSLSSTALALATAPPTAALSLLYAMAVQVVHVGYYLLLEYPSALVGLLRKWVPGYGSSACRGRPAPKAVGSSCTSGACCPCDRAKSS